MKPPVKVAFSFEHVKDFTLSRRICEITRYLSKILDFEKNVPILFRDLTRGTGLQTVLLTKR